MIWGAVGPRRFFASGSRYHPLLWFFLLGAVLPLAVWLLRKYAFPQSRWFSKVHVPLFLGGLNYIPPATGTNYGSWAIVGLVFGLWIRRRQHDWWKRYNFILSSALDCSVAIAGVVIFFTVFYTGAADKFSWWGTNVYQVCETSRDNHSLAVFGADSCRIPVTGRDARTLLFLMERRLVIDRE